MVEADYKVIKYSSRVELRKNDEAYMPLYVRVRNESAIGWWDGRNGKKGHEKFLRVAPEMFGELSKRYFELLSIGHYTEDQFFKKVFKKRGSKNKDKHVVNPGEEVLLMIRVRARDYTPIGGQSIKIGLIERDTKIMLRRHPDSKTGNIKVLPVRYKDMRMLNLNSIGEVEFTYSNDIFDKLKYPDDRQAIIMAVWKRIDRLPKSIKAFIGQKDANPILYLWVNNREHDDEIKKVIDESQLPTKAYFSPNNIGGYGRFYLAKDLANQHKTVIFIDDDQIPKDNAFKTLVKEHKPESIWGPYATRTPSRNDYWLRDQIKPGEEADYIATSGMICDTSIFVDSIIFECPKKYWFIEDLWLCYVAQAKNGWNLKKSAAEIETEQDEVGQWRPMVDLKNEFFRYLLKKGMRIHEREVK